MSVLMRIGIWYAKRRAMKAAKAWINGIHWINIAGLAAQLLQVIPQKPWVMAAQGVLAALMPSLHGMGHKVAFGTDQTPEP